jgi:hypothetical protein
MLHLSSDEQKSHIIVCQNLQKHLQRDPQFFSKVITDGYTHAGTEGKEIWWYHHNASITGCTCQVQNTRFLQTLATVVQSLDSLYQVTREVLQKGQHGIEGAFSYHRENNLITPHKIWRKMNIFYSFHTIFYRLFSFPIKKNLITTTSIYNSQFKRYSLSTMTLSICILFVSNH